MNTLDALATALADRYRIERELGQGGMATVYLAQDLKHDRKVAIKVLRPELAAVIGAERFLREIKTIANLQHPHILGLIDSGEVNGTAYYVMPFVEGEALRDRLNREKQLPIPDALRIATEVASALDYAHRHGVIHRDIKPENILLHDGSALVADFGIALAVSSAGGNRMTETGMSLGTPHYMSPEQAMGEREITARSDVYALGCVTYEMLTGDPPFTGSSAQAIVAKVMTEKPASLILRRDRVPAAVEDAVLTALEKLPADRFASAAEFAAALKGEGARTTATRRFAAPGPRLRSLMALGAIAIAATLAAAFFAWKAAQRPAGPVTRLMLDLPDLRVYRPEYHGGALALSPDGARLAYVARPPGAPARLMLRELGDMTVRQLDGTDGADGPFFSPDGRWIGYSAAGKLYKVAVSGGAPTLLGETGSGDLLGSAAWFDDGTILFTNSSFALLSVPADGGPSTTIVAPPGNFGMAFPTALPRRDVILVTLCSNNCARMTLMTLNLKTLVRDTLLVNAIRAWYLPTGHLIVARQDGSVVGGPFDLDQLRFTAPPVAVLAPIQLELGITPELTVANNGTLIYLPASPAGGDATIARVTRAGAAKTLDPDWVATFSSIALSPDGRRLAVSIASGTTHELWMKQLDAGPLTRLSFAGTINYRPSWRPDGRTLSFTSDQREARSYLYQMRADGSDQPERLLPRDTSQIDEALWSGDGRWLVYRLGVIAGSRDIYARQLSGDTTRTTVSAGPFDEYMPALSPDGRWIAYVSEESGRTEVYVRPFPETSRARWQVSPLGGTAPAWSHTGKELFYIDRSDSLIAATVGGTTDFQVSARHALFSTGPFVQLPYHRSYDVSPDDQSFVLLRRPLVAGTDEPRLTVVLNWFGELTAKLGKGQ